MNSSPGSSIDMAGRVRNRPSLLQAVEEEQESEGDIENYLESTFGSGSRRGLTRGESSSSNIGSGSRRELQKLSSKREITKLSNMVSSEREDAIDSNILNHILQETGSHAYGVRGISVWVFDDESDRLVPRGWWHSPKMPSSKALISLFDRNSANYEPQKPVNPGSDLAGLLWLEAESENTADEREAGSFNRQSIFQFPRSSNNGPRQSKFMGRVSMMITKRPIPDDDDESDYEDYSDKLNWRDLKSLVDDPDTSKGPRLALLEKAGFCKAAGITFTNDLCKGMVIKFIHNDIDEEILDSLPNVSYLRHATQLIGSCISMTASRRAALGQRIQQGVPNTAQVVSTEGNLGNGGKKKKSSILPKRLKVMARKMKGGGMQIPPALSRKQTILTMFGSFCGLLMLSSLSQFFKHVSDDELYILLGSFAAVMTLQFGLSAAPSALPMVIILGHAVSGAIGMAFTYVPESFLPLWVRLIIAPTIAIGTMVRWQIAHPPAGGLALVLAQGYYGWDIYALIVLGAVLSIIPALIINNWSNKRQYPTFWGFEDLDWYKKCRQRQSSKKMDGVEGDKKSRERVSGDTRDESAKSSGYISN